MKLTVKALGTGANDDPYTPPFPTCVVDEFDESTKLMLVDVDDDRLPQEWRDAYGTAALPTDADGVVTDADPAKLDELATALDAQYPEHDGEYRPEFK